MRRAPTLRARPEKAARPPTPADWPRAVGFAAVAGLAVVGLYLLHPILGARRLPIGPDGPVYTWWTNLAAAEGLGVIPQRPGVPGIALVLGSVFGTEPLETLALLGPVLAASCGLAGAALLEASLGPSAFRASAAVLLVGAFAGYLAAGWLANLALTVLFLGAATSLALAGRSWRAVVGGAALLAAGGLAHSLFFVLALMILTGVVLFHLPEAIRHVRGGGRPWNTTAARVAGAAAGGAAGATLGFGLIARAPIRVSTSQDALLRRIGLGDVLTSWLRQRLLVDGRRAVFPLAAAGWLAWTGLRRRASAPGTGEIAPEGRRYLWSLCGTWALVTVAGLLALAVTVRGPANRLLPFAFFVPLTAAVALHRLLTAPATRVERIGAWVAGAVIVAAGFYGWVDRPPYVEEAELLAARGAARSVAHLPPGTPLVFIVDTSEDAAGFHVVRFSNVIRMELPPERIPDLRIAVARPSDYLAGRPTTIGDLEHDSISRATVAETAALARRGAILVVQPFNRPGFGEAVSLGTVVSPDVVSLRGGRVAGAPLEAEERPGLAPGPLVLLSMATLVIVWILGAGWARWALAGAAPLAMACAAPSAGVAVAVFSALAADRLALASGPAGPIAAVALGAVGYAAALLSPRPEAAGSSR
ncbi:MAG: hypothetical protein ACRDIX_07940 [Actinomycetota bacterium]